MAMCGTDVLFGKTRGAEMRALMYRLTGKPCPCFRGEWCPMLPRPTERQSAA